MCVSENQEYANPTGTSGAGEGLEGLVIGFKAVRASANDRAGAVVAGQWIKEAQDDVALSLRSTGAPFYKRRPTPKPGLDFCPRDCAETSACISDEFPQGVRWCAARQPMGCRGSIMVRVPPSHCTVRCVPSTYCSRAALHVAPHALRLWQARRASRWGRSLPTGDAENRRETCPAQNEEFCTTKAKRAKSEILPATHAFRWLRDSSFSRASLAPVIDGETGTQTRCN